MKKLFVGVAALVAVPGIAHAQDFQGPRIEARVGYETPTLSDNTGVYKLGSAVSYGGEVGFDVGKKVTFGAYASYEWSSVDLCDNSGNCLGEDATLGVGGRIGLVVSPKVLVYGKVGYTRIRLTAKSGAATASDSEDGVQGALGVEANFSKHVYGKLEFNYGDYGSLAGIANLQRRHVAMGIGLRF